MNSLTNDNTHEVYDVAIVGGGIAGLLLAYRFITETDNTVVVIDATEHRPDHVFGFFDDGRDSLRLATLCSSHAFNRWQILDSDQTIQHIAHSHQYRLIQAADYENYLLELMAESTRFSYLNKTVTTHQSVFEETKLSFADNTFCRAGICFDSRPSVASNEHLIQHFHGLYIEAEQEVFEPNQIQLMDFSVSQSDGMHFIYVLPLSETSALLESTVYSTMIHAQEWYEEQISNYFTKMFPGTKFKVSKREAGAIPLNYKTPDKSYGIPVGLRAGAMRTSSGYAFSQIHDQIYSINLKQPEQLSAPHTKLERLMDDILLRVLKKHPEKAPDIFTKMAAAVNADDFASFMLGRSSLGIKMKLVAALPKLPFLLQACFGKRLTQ